MLTIWKKPNRKAAEQGTNPRPHICQMTNFSFNYFSKAW